MFDKFFKFTFKNIENDLKWFIDNLKLTFYITHYQKHYKSTPFFSLYPNTKAMFGFQKVLRKMWRKENREEKY